MVSSVIQFVRTRKVDDSKGLSFMCEVLNSMLFPFFVMIFAPTLKLMLLEVVTFSGRMALSNYNF
jgi:hypothetical protein